MIMPTGSSGKIFNSKLYLYWCYSAFRLLSVPIVKAYYSETTIDIEMKRNFKNVSNHINILCNSILREIVRLKRGTSLALPLLMIDIFENLYL